MTIDPDMTIDPNVTENVCVKNDLCEQDSNVVIECPRYADMVHGVADVPEGGVITTPNETINMSEFRNIIDGSCLKMTPVHLGLKYFLLYFGSFLWGGGWGWKVKSEAVLLFSLLMKLIQFWKLFLDIIKAIALIMIEDDQCILQALSELNEFANVMSWPNLLIAIVVGKIVFKIG